jgi:GTP-binding protein
VVANKADSPRHEHAAGEFHALGFPELIPVSAEHRRGLADLELAIAERLPAAAPEPEAGVPDAALRVAVVGRPNVGKSSLVNRWIGDGVAVVSPEPGTTRDSTDHRLRVGRDEVVLIDTAGLRRPGRRADALERGSAFMALRSIERAHVAVLVLDASEGVTEQDAKIARLAQDRGRPLVIALNKSDLVGGAERWRALEQELERRLHFVHEAGVLKLSALTGAGANRVLPAALRLWKSTRRAIPTSELNRALKDALAGLQPPMGGRHRPKLFYATQTASEPFSVLVFASHPEAIPESYRRYLESFFRKRFALRSAPVRVRFRSRAREHDDA